MDSLYIEILTKSFAVKQEKGLVVEKAGTLSIQQIGGLAASVVSSTLTVVVKED